MAVDVLLLPGARELLDTLRPRYRLAALSNSNAVHWDRNTMDLGVTGLFDAAFESMGFMPAAAG